MSKLERVGQVWLIIFLLCRFVRLFSYTNLNHNSHILKATKYYNQAVLGLQIHISAG